MTIEELAEILHTKLCHINHTDGCTWYYETKEDKWTKGRAHERWYNKAIDVVIDSGLDYRIIAKVVEAL